jgi:hypothetical protein
MDLLNAKGSSLITVQVGIQNLVFVDQTFPHIHLLVVFLLVCGGHLRAETQVYHLYSHAKYGDHDYKNHEDCEWKIETTRGSRIKFTFLTFHLEEDLECGYDSVDVQGGYDESPPSFGPYCGTKVLVQALL